MTRLIAASLSAALLYAAPPAPAHGADADVATSLFQEGVRLMQDGRCDGATPVRATCEAARVRFERAFSLYPEGLGALRNRAFVDRGLGRWRAARDGFRELERRARAHDNPERRAWADYARKDADALEARIPTVTVEAPASVPQDTLVTLDGETVPRASFGAPIERDPGTSELVVSRGGDVRHRTRVELAPGARKTILVALSSAPVVAASSNAPTAQANRPSTTGPKWLVATGALTTGAGLLIGYLALRKHDEVCDDSNLCEPQGLDDGRTLAHASTAVTGVGLAALAAGALWWWSRSRTAEPRLAVAPSVSEGRWGLALGGRF